MSTSLPNSHAYHLQPWMRSVLREILGRWGRDFETCEQCGNPTNGHSELHHTRYEGATIHDIEIVCRSCNRLARNRGFA